jgi:hypothetical protein
MPRGLLEHSQPVKDTPESKAPLDAMLSIRPNAFLELTILPIQDCKPRSPSYKQVAKVCTRIEKTITEREVQALVGSV